MTHGIGAMRAEDCLGGRDGREAVVKNCSVTGNRQHGIDVLGESIVIDNRASQNGVAAAGAGIRTFVDLSPNPSPSGSRIEGNQTRDNIGTGILANPTGGVIIRNTSANNTIANFNPAGGPNFGPVQTPESTISPTASHVF